MFFLRDFKDQTILKSSPMRIAWGALFEWCTELLHMQSIPKQLLIGFHFSYAATYVGSRKQGSSLFGTKPMSQREKMSPAHWETNRSSRDQSSECLKTCSPLSKCRTAVMMSLCIEWNIPDSACTFKYKSVYSGVLCEVRGIKQPSGGESCLRASSTLALPSSHEPEPQKQSGGIILSFSGLVRIHFLSQLHCKSS